MNRNPVAQTPQNDGQMNKRITHWPKLKLRTTEYNWTVHHEPPNYLLNLIKTVITLREGIPRNQLLFIHNGEPLADKDKQLADYNIDYCNSFYLLVAPFEFSASAGLGHPLKVIWGIPDWETDVIDFVEPWFTVRDIKTVMESKCGFPWESMAPKSRWKASWGWC